MRELSAVNYARHVKTGEFVFFRAGERVELPGRASEWALWELPSEDSEHRRIGEVSDERKARLGASADQTLRRVG